MRFATTEDDQARFTPIVFNGELGLIFSLDSIGPNNAFPSIHAAHYQVSVKIKTQAGAETIRLKSKVQDDDYVLPVTVLGARFTGSAYLPLMRVDAQPLVFDQIQTVIILNTVTNKSYKSMRIPPAANK